MITEMESKKAQTFISCICMICWVRNDHSSDDGWCQNGHDYWLEYRDVVSKNEFFMEACEKLGVSQEYLTGKFLDSNVLSLKELQDEI